MQQASLLGKFAIALSLVACCFKLTNRGFRHLCRHEQITLQQALRQREGAVLPLVIASHLAQADRCVSLVQMDCSCETLFSAPLALPDVTILHSHEPVCRDGHHPDTATAPS